jgi:endosialidase-like protein
MKNLKITFIIFIIITSLSANLSAQGVAINESGTSADASAILDVTSTEKGLLIPRMTATQLAAISSPATGLLVYQTDGTTGFYYNAGTTSSPNWLQLSSTLIEQIGDADSDTKIQVEETADEDKIRFDVAGNEAMVIDADGSIGVGTSSPAGVFDVSTLQYGVSVVDVQQTGEGNSFYPATSHWQSFVPGVTGKLTRIDVSAHNSPYGCTLKIYSGEGTSGTLLYTQSSLNLSYDISINLSSGPVLVVGQTYTWELSRTTDFTLIGNQFSTYSAGTSDLGGNADYYFKTYMSTTSTVSSILVESNGYVGILESSPVRSLHVGDVMRLEPTSAPTTPAKGDLYIDETSNKLRYYNGTAWVELENQFQDLSVSSNTLNLSGSSATVSLASYLDNTDGQDISLSGNTLSLSGSSATVSLASYLDNTDGQDISLSGNTLSLSGSSATVSLASYLDNTDGQDISLSGNTLSLSGSSATVSLASYLDNTDGQDLGLSGNTLSLSGSSATVNLAGYLDNTDEQDLSVSGNTLSLSGSSATVSLANYLDNTDAQDLSLSGNTLSLSGSSTTADFSSLTLQTMVDNDNDTKIQVEESSDDDIIRFDIGGTEKWTMTGSRIENQNTGRSVFIGYEAGKNDDLIYRTNVYVGYKAGVANTSGEYNTAVGGHSLLNSTGSRNTTLGNSSGSSLTTGNDNTFLGSLSGFYQTGGSSNTLIGYNAGRGSSAHSKTGNVFIGNEAGYSETSDNKLYIENSSSSSPLIWGDFANDLVNINGKMGIGTSSPSCPLEIDGYDLLASTYGYLNSSGNTGTYSGSSVPYSIKASHSIQAAEFHAVSDKRIKTNLELSTTKSDLDIIKQIQVTNYSHIDTVVHGSAMKKGFIAQQVESVFPQAVNQSSNYIPNIYSLTTQIIEDETAAQMTISVINSHQLSKGDHVRLITANGQLELEVLATPSSTQFTIETVKDLGEQIFVYGKKVEDFRAVDYDRVFTTGIGAIQELSNQVNKLRLKVESLESMKAEELKVQNKELLKRLQILEELVF